jgi:hypothetical protein
VAFLALTLLTLALCFAMAGLYKIVADLSATPGVHRLSWPLPGFLPGDAFPLWIRERLPSGSGLVALCDDSEASMSTVSSVAAAAAERFAWTVIPTSRDASLRISESGLLKGSNLSLPADRDLDALSSETYPVVAVLAFGHVMDALAGVQGPASIRRMAETYVPESVREDDGKDESHASHVFS